MGKVLIVDDDEPVRVVLGEILQQAGHEVAEASDGAEVMALVLENKPDVILLDVSMPVIDGFDVLQELKADPRTADIPVIMLTGSDHPTDFTAARSLGAWDYITKPWSSGEVPLRVAWAIRDS